MEKNLAILENEALSKMSTTQMIAMQKSSLIFIQEFIAHVSQVSKIEGKIIFETGYIKQNTVTPNKVIIEFSAEPINQNEVNNEQ
ncbi:MAG: hypothetical protein WC799_08485 [Desulfobacteraceae bacterium]|jgi:hypothetical protein